MLISLDLILAFLEPYYDSLAWRGGSGSYPEDNILLTNWLQIYFKYETGIWSSRTNKSPQALLLLDAQQPPALGNVFKRLSMNSLTNACWRNTQNQNKVFREKIWWLKRWVDAAGNSREGTEEGRGLHWALLTEVTMDFAQQKRRPDSASPNPTSVPMHMVPSAPGGLWIPDWKDLSKGLRRSWERAQIQQVLRRTDNKKVRHIMTVFVHAVMAGDRHENMSWNPWKIKEPEWD